MQRDDQIAGYRWCYAALWAVAGAATLCCYVLQWPDPVDPDGYFYFKNIQELAAWRGFYFQDYSLSFLLPTALQWLVHDIHLAWALGLSLVFGISVFALVARAVWREERLSWLLPPFVLLWLACQLPWLELVLAYCKNSFALAMLLLAAAFAERAKKRTGLRAWCLPAGFALLALASHKSMLLWILLVGLLCFPPHKIWEALRQGRRARWLGLGLILLPTVIVILFYRRIFSQLQYSLAWSSDPEPFWVWFSHSLEVTPPFLFAFASTATALALLGWRAWSAPSRWLLPCLAWLAYGLVVFQPFQAPGSTGLHYRMWLLLPLFPALLASELFPRLRLSRQMLALAGLVGVAVWLRPGIHESLARGFVPYTQLEADVRKIPLFVTAADRLVCHHGLEFYVDFVTNLRCRSFVDRSSQRKAWRVAYVADYQKNAALEQDLEGFAVLRIGENYRLLEEVHWQGLVKKYHTPAHPRNPDQERPDFIRDQER